jgi:hypothetical protein
MRTGVQNFNCQHTSQLSTASLPSMYSRTMSSLENDGHRMASHSSQPQSVVTRSTCFTLLVFELTAFDSLRKKYTEQVKRLGQTGFGLTIEQLETSAYSTILGKYTLLCIYAQPVEYHTAQIKMDFPWFQGLHGWWKDNPVCNRTFSTAHPGQNFSAQVAVLFGLLESTHTPPR